MSTEILNMDDRGYKRDWVKRKPFFIVKRPDGRFLVIINERKLVTETPISDLINSLEEQINTLKDMQREHVI